MSAKKISSLFICILFCLVLISSFAFVAIESNHHCEGEVCHICLEIDKIIFTIKSVFQSTIIVTLFLKFILISISYYQRKYFSLDTSLFSLKVMLTI